jgi:RNA polymerase sigma-70 factor (ECF subfamily)
VGPTPSDQEIISAVLAGAEARFAELYERYQRRLFGLLWHACGDRELAEDIGQETFLRAFRKLHMYSGTAQFYTWLARIAMNLLISNRRKRRLETELDRQSFDIAVDSQGHQEQPSSSIELNEIQTSVQQAIAMLDEERRVVLLLRDFEDLDYETIANILNLPIGTVRSRIHRARAELKQWFQAKAPQLGIAEES